MILTVCPNPCVDTTLYLNKLESGKLNRVIDKEVSLSGKALNVAIGVSRLKKEAFATGFMFNNNGQIFEQNLSKEGVKSTFVWAHGDVRTNYKVIDNNYMMTEINEPGEEISIAKQEELLQLVSNLSNKSEIIVMSGSLPKGVGNDFYLKISKMINSNIKRIIDTEGEKLTLAIANGAYLVKPNLYELECIYGNTLTTKDETIKACCKLIELGAENVLLSLGGKGAILTNGIDSYYAASPKVDVLSTVGAGDSMVSAVCCALSENLSMPEILKSAVAAGTSAVTTKGTNLFDYNTYTKLFEQTNVEKI